MGSTYDPRFGPAAQTPSQRAFVLRQMQELVVGLQRQTSPAAQHLFAGYVAGELSWTQLRLALDSLMG